MPSQYDYQVKIVLIGDSGVGKTTFFRAFTQLNLDEQTYATIGVDFWSQVVPINNSKVKVVVWDTAGMERFRDLTKQYYRGTDIIILFYDITNKTSFESLDTWIKSVKKIVPEGDNIFAIVGTKLDFEEKRTVTRQEAEQFAQNNNATYFEVCSSNHKDDLASENTKAVILSTINTFSTQAKNKKYSATVDLTSSSPNKHSRCC